MFSTMAWTPENLKFVRVACVTLEVLISYDIGFEYLKDNKTIVQISEMLKLELEIHQNAAKAGTPVPQGSHDTKGGRLLSPEKVLKTMAREYFTMLGTLSSNLLGLEIMSRNHIFDYIKPLAELPGRDDLSHLIMTSLDYNVPGASRHILQKILTSNSRVVRYLATKYMRYLLRSGAHDFSNWGVELLVAQLNDPDTKVSQLALNVLDEACDDPNGLDSLIHLQPPLLKLGKNGKSLMLRFLSRKSGLDYLLGTSFVEQEEKLWLSGENANYVIQVEGAISEALTPLIWRQREAPDQGNNGVYLPPHFYGELAKTEEGCDILKRSNSFPTFVKIATDQRANPLERRAAIFAIGQIGSSQAGFRFLEDHNVVPLIVEMAEKATCLSLRGTCFYALGMISCIERANEILSKCGWESPSDLTSRISVPKDLQKSTFLKITPYDFKGSWAGNAVDPLQSLLDNAIKQEIVTFVGNLASHITAETASKNLKRLKLKHPDLFASGDMLFMAFSLLDHYKYRLITRRFIYDCFDTAIFSSDPFENTNVTYDECLSMSSSNDAF
ncbi:cytosolic regulator of adenylyl cyclase [Cavenderia fasciculata]|uniref:Cytosolic regulator of adenylyl cyclase n=1 Tax=Cavenderia fasciculata TaxID=261658 RepID=F4PXH0_CACFS|nr:cytosolic regulator of adenylyl cyclase [Cavenderia fasciculata]EGG19480.1 cytosolic regulator of adenylyl cyclase [Cavenderia fasciculata]|eukprot:XP_004357774.1 cytosolic regulator of adenylyl cyclase [Cavenderia fasciculata]